MSFWKNLVSNQHGACHEQDSYGMTFFFIGMIARAPNEILFATRDALCVRPSYILVIIDRLDFIFLGAARQFYFHHIAGFVIHQGFGQR